MVIFHFFSLKSMFFRWVSKKVAFTRIQAVDLFFHLKTGPFFSYFSDINLFLTLFTLGFDKFLTMFFPSSFWLVLSYYMSTKHMIPGKNEKTRD